MNLSKISKKSGKAGAVGLLTLLSACSTPIKQEAVKESKNYIDFPCNEISVYQHMSRNPYVVKYFNGNIRNYSKYDTVEASKRPYEYKLFLENLLMEDFPLEN